MTRTPSSQSGIVSPAQRASAANRERQMLENRRDGRLTPPPRDPEAAKKAYDDRHNTPTHRR